jgi:predicted nuclease with TOPRIM domain
MLTQLYALQQIPAMEAELRELKAIQCEKDSAVNERRYLMDGLTKLKVERDYLEGVLTAAETENYRLAKVVRITREQVVQLQTKKWWHSFWPWRI